MLLVNTARSYPRVALSITTAHNVADLLGELADVTRQSWPDLSDEYLATNADYIAGTAAGLITVIYKVVDVDRTRGGRDGQNEGPVKLVFSVRPAPELGYLIGKPQPGGPWRRGEARGTRAVLTPNADEPGADDDPTWDKRWIGPVLETARVVTRDVARIAPVDEHVSTSISADGTVVVRVPMGTKVLIEQVPINER